ncbi:MAG TPA: alpha-amylase family glycosyl hydrolase [Longimicrobiales bacterium]
MIRIAALVQAGLILATAPLFAQNPNASAPEWRRNSVCYEVFVRSFYDSDGDGVGDLRGLTQKLDYINDGNAHTQRDLGANCIWLMPIAQSPSYHGYDVSNHYQVNRDYGTTADFKEFMREAHGRGIRVLVDLVLNHSSSQHPFFRSALLSADSPYRDWYVWSPTEKKTIGWQAPTWHRAGARNEFYYGLFWAGMPDLNLANPAVKAEYEKVARYWLEEMGVDGFRLDAVHTFFENPNGRWDHAPANHPWLRDYAAALRRIKADVFTVGEAWDTIGAVLPYYPDQLDAYFAFEVADAVFESVRNGNGARLLAAVERAQRQIPDHRWGMFLRNHDQTRTLTELNGDVARNKLAVSLLLTLPGLPFVYYGEEIGMTGAKQSGDERLRTPMHWTRSNAAGFTPGTPWEPLAADSFTANVEVLENDPNSLLNLHRKLIHLRTANAALANGEFIPLRTATGTVGYLRHTPHHAVLVLANLTAQPMRRPMIESGPAVMATGRYHVDALLGAVGTNNMAVGRNGRLGSVGIREIGPYETVIVDLRRIN